MYDKEADFIFEAYQKIYEAPIGAGSAYDDDVQIGGERIEQLGGKTYGEITEEDIYSIIRNIKGFLENHEGTVYPGTIDDLKLEIKVIIQDTVEGVNATKAGYAARVITNELKQLNIIDETGDMVHVQDVDKVSEIGDELEDTLDLEDRPAQFILGVQYNVDRDIPMSASIEAKEGHAALMSAGMAFGTHKGTDIIKTMDLKSYDIGKNIALELEELGAITKADKEQSDEERIVDVGDEEDDYETAVSSEYEKLRRDIEGGSSPTFRPEGF